MPVSKEHVGGIMSLVPEKERDMYKDLTNPEDFCSECMTDSDLSLRVEKLEKIVTELEFTNANIIKDYEELITICHALKVKYVDLKNAVEGTRISRIIT